MRLATTAVPGELLGQPGKTLFLQFGKKITYGSGINVSFNLFDWQEKIKSQIASEYIDNNATQKAASWQIIKSQLGQYYYSLLIVRESIFISSKDIQLGDRILAITNEKYKEGLVDTISVNQALINLKAMKLNLFQSEDLANSHLYNIKLLTGLPQSIDLKFLEVFNDSALNSGQSTEIGEDNTLAVFLKAITISQLQTKLQKGLMYPKLSLNGYVGYQQFSDNLHFPFTQDISYDSRYIGLILNWPLFTGFYNVNKLRNAKVEQEIAIKEYTEAKNKSNTYDKYLKDHYYSAKNILSESKELFRIHGKNLELSLLKFKEGLISVDTYLRMFEEYLGAENNYLNTLSNLMNDYAIILSRQ